ncbi:MULTISPECIES: T9SS-dependent M36 family metallopeptidase [Flavobacterium]|uniref:T9SS-dependent M36 family metallopeptidase n=1 Tax=Flavobacterium hankyongi TaxID=1176532 RepID=A0ABP8ZSM2_9FLAO|nr:T9SS-dependent M36 family metallopeptidase [Flavobacterium sp. N1846]
MKKITLLFFLFISTAVFSQEPIDKIKKYISENKVKFGLTNQDISDLVIVNDFSSETTGINNYHVKQRISGIEVFNSDSNFWIKSNEVINGGEEFIPNLIQKINTSNPSLSVTDALSGILSQIDNSQLNSVQILESGANKYKLSNGILAEDPIRAQLVYFQTETNTIRLSWDYEFYSQDTKHLWNLKIDAVTGKILDKNDLVISCNFGSNHSNHSHAEINHFTQSFYKKNTTSTLLNPGTTKYRVIPWNYESPNHSPFALITNPEYVTNASPNGWHNNNGTIGGGSIATRFTTTRGNNVLAKDDFDTNNTGGNLTTGAGTYPDLTFDFPYPGTSVAANTYIDAATTNLFYMNNIMHDLWYQYGFNEANKNFQQSNYGRGGLGGDPVNADAQDGGGIDPNINNANFATPTDGSAPRMQMYLWNVGPAPKNLIINSPASIAGEYVARDNVFSPGHVNLPAAPGLTTNIILYDDAVGTGSDACEAAVNGTQLSGKIVIIRRGNCEFQAKVYNAQLGGAAAVIIVNNDAANPDANNLNMSGANASITIPAVFVSYTVGEAIIAAIGSGTVNGTLRNDTNVTFVNTDGDFDNGIIAHEYGHGISTRLSGNCLSGSEQQGEGWSDWFWLIMQIKPGDTRNNAKGIGTFAMNQATNGPGIRQYRYSTDMAVNPHTFGSTNGMLTPDGTAVDSHSVGSVWAVMLWDLAWNYIDKYGYDPNIYTGTGGNNKVMRLILDAIKLDGCSPTFVTARDAIIAADQATTGGQNYCMIWKTFARRGLGVNASSGTNSGIAGIQDQVEDFTEPAPGPNCTLSVNHFDNNNGILIYPNPSNGLINIRINSFIGKATVEVVDINGRVVYSLNNTEFSNEKSIDLNHLQAGVYVVKISGDELNYTKKIILN